jgi:hypothetical protein
MPNDQALADLIAAMTGLSTGMQAGLDAANTNADTAAAANTNAMQAAAAAAAARLKATTAGNSAQRFRLTPFTGTKAEQWRNWRRILEETASTNGWVSGHPTLDLVGRRALISALHDPAGGMIRIPGGGQHRGPG